MSHTQTLSTELTQAIQCAWSGRNEDYIHVNGASSLNEAREHALEFFRNDDNGCDDEGITLDEGYKMTWKYDEPQPADWQDYYVFRSVDAHPIDQREWWEK